MAECGVHLEVLQGLAGGHVGGLEGDPQRPCVATGGWARQHHAGHGGDVDGVLPGSQALHFKELAHNKV